MHPTARLQAPRRPWVAWLVLCVWVLAALAPAVSHALAAEPMGGPARLEVCTSSGAQWLPLTSDAVPAEAPADTAPAMGFSHCPWCLQPTDSGAAPPPHTPLRLWVSSGPQACPVWQVFFFPTPFFLAAAPRGPPARA